MTRPTKKSAANRNPVKPAAKKKPRAGERPAPRRKVAAKAAGPRRAAAPIAAEPDRRRQAEAVLRFLHAEYPDATCELHHSSALELLVATILSAQCTDERVNKVTASLFKKYRTAADYADAPPGVLEEDIRSTGFFNNKAKSLRGMGAALVERHDGQVPRTMAELLQIPGVARKTANVVLGTVFGIPEGVVVDTHVHRLSHRLGLSSEKSADKVERDLMAALPRDEWVFAGHAIIWHGRRVCHARKPACADCGLAAVCPSAGVGAAT